MTSSFVSLAITSLIARYSKVLVITLASTLLILTSIIGISGALLNSRPILAFYTLLLWPCLISMLTIGYTSFKRSTFALDRKLNEKWSKGFDPGARLVIQEVLHCCGFYNALREISVTSLQQSLRLLKFVCQMKPPYLRNVIPAHLSLAVRASCTGSRRRTSS